MRPTLTTPDHDCCYSSFGYILLGQIVETKRGMAFLTAAKADLFDSLWMSHEHVSSSDVNA